MKNLALTLASLTFVFAANAQLTIDQDISAEDAAQQLVGIGVSIDNVIVTAADSSWAYYNNFNTELSDSEGLLLTTGKARNAIVVDGENGTGLPIIENQTDCINCDEYDNGFPGSALLNSVHDRTTFDATTFQFDVTVQGDSLEFEFTFASEEYEEWVGSSFNDVFGFFISGPGGFNDVNIALVPGTTEPVAINSINHIFNTEYYYDNRNPLGQNIQYDGFTLNLKAQVGDLIPCETYTLKLIIADGSDRLYDSAVFVEKLNSNFSNIVTSTVGGTPYMVEGCNDGTITFVPDEVLPVDQDILYSFGGTADVLTDYTTAPALGDNIPNNTQTITIPANEESVSIDVFPIADGIVEGDENLTLYVINTVCDVEIQDSVVFVIKDSLELDVTPTIAEICPGEFVSLQGISDTNGNFTFSWDPSNLVDSPNTLVTNASPTEDTIFTLTSNLASCVAEVTAEVTVKDIDIEFDTTPVNCIGSAIGEIDVTITGAADPYTVTWTDSDGIIISMSEDLTGLEVGVYTITVLDADGCEVTQDVSIVEEDVLVSNLVLSDYNGSTISCNGVCDGGATVAPSGGVGPYTITWSEVTPPNSTSISDLCPGTYSVTIEDNAGCSITEFFGITEPDLLEGAVVSITEILCNGTSTGQAEVTASGGTTPYFYSWSDDPSGTPVIGQGPILTNLGDGTYYVVVTDNNGCIAENSVEVTVQPPPPPISIVLTSPTYPNGFNTTCFDATDGSASAVVSGGVPGYTLGWSDEFGNPLGTGNSINGLGCGEYTLTAMDQNGCVETETITITCPDQITITSVVTPNPCNDLTATDGEIDITPAGGTGMGYTFSWVDQNNVDFGVSEDLTNLPSGTYTVTVTDSDGCERDFTISVTNEDAIVVDIDLIQNVSCFGACDGSIDISVSGFVGDFTVEWTTDDGVYSNDMDISGLCADTYFFEFTGDDGCQATETFIITEPSEIIIDVIDVVNPTCSGQNSGSIDIEVSGGDGPLTIEWEPNGLFPGSTDEDIEQLIDETYTVNVTDQSNMCVATLDVTLEAPQAILLDIQLSSYDGGFFTSCNGEDDGQLTAAASGGNPDFTNLPFGYFYDWSNLPAGNDPSLPNQLGLPGGVTYGLIVTDTAGCQAEILIPTFEPDILEAAETIFDVTCLGNNDGIIVPNIIGGSGNYVSYDWTGDIGTNAVDADTLFNLSLGTYTLEVFDSNGCTFIEEFEITEPEELEVEITDITVEDCLGAGTASVTVAASGGTPNYSYDWVDEDMNTYSGDMLTGLQAGEYTLTVTDDNGCTVEEIVDVTSDEVLTLTVDLFQVGTGDFTLACLGDENGSATANVIGGIPDYTYEWTNSNDVIIGSEPTITDLGAGTYYIEIEDFAGCVLNDSIVITEPATEFMVTGNILSPISCNGECTGEIEVIATGGDMDYTYLWEVDDIELEFGMSADSLCAGMYEVLVTDANGCDSLLMFELIEPEPIVVDFSPSLFECGFNVSCFGILDGELTYSLSGGVPNYIIEWTGPIGGNAIDADTLFNIGAGVYTLTVTDDVGCEVASPFEMTQPEELILDPNVTDVSCFGLDDGSIDANPTGGCAPYSFVWSNTTDDIQTITDLSPATYDVTVTDENGCEAMATEEIEEPEELTVTATATDTTCGEDNGSIDSTPSGGTTPYTFDWNNGADDVEDPQNLGSGPYTLILTDDNGCEATVDVDVAESEGITYTSDVTVIECYNEETGCIEVTILTSNGNPVETWTDVNGNAVVPCDVGAGDYILNITDDAGCEADEIFTLANPAEIIIDLNSPLYPNGFNISEIDGSDGSIETTVTGGTPDLTYSWSSGAGFSSEDEDLAGLSSGVYDLLVTDANGCEASDQIELIAPEDLTLPTGLSPNGDFLNDTYFILGIDQYDKVEITVFNRWGNKVYTNDDYDNSWVGQNDDGEALANGTYYVIAVGTKAGETKELNSFVDLRR